MPVPPFGGTMASDGYPGRRDLAAAHFHDRAALELLVPPLVRGQRGTVRRDRPRRRGHAPAERGARRAPPLRRPRAARAAGRAHRAERPDPAAGDTEARGGHAALTRLDRSVT